MKSKVHSHPELEKKLGLDDEHVIIDRELYHEVLIMNSTLKIIALRHFNRESK